MNTWNIPEPEWANIVASIRAQKDILEDGAYVRLEPQNGGDDPQAMELHFYASALNRPPAFHFPFTEAIAGLPRLVALVGRAWHETTTGFVEFEVVLVAAGQALMADYEGGAGDYDDATFPDIVQRAMSGTPADREWLMREFDRLLKFVRSVPATP